MKRQVLAKLTLIACALIPHACFGEEELRSYFHFGARDKAEYVPVTGGGLIPMVCGQSDGPHFISLHDDSEDCWVDLAGCKKLQGLWIFGIGLKSPRFPEFLNAKRNELQDLRINVGRIEPDYIRPILELPKLETLCIRMMRQNGIDDGLNTMNGPSGVKSLDLAYSWKLTSVDAIVKNFPELRVLKLYATGIQPDSLQAMTKLEKLAVLNLAGINLAGSGIKPGQTFPSLVALGIDQARIGRPEMNLILASRQLKALSMRGTRLTFPTDCILSEIADHGGVVEVVVDDLPISKAGVERFFASRQVFAFSASCTAVEDSWLEAAKGTETLRLLNVTSPRVRGKDREDLIGDRTLRACAKWPKLRELHIESTSVSDEGVAALVETNSDLEVIHMSSTRTTDKSLQELAKLKHLKHLRVQNTDMTIEGINAFKARCEKCEVSTSF